MGDARSAPTVGRFLGSQLKTLLMLLIVGLVAAAIVVGTIPWYLSHPERFSRIVAKAFPELLADVTCSHVRLRWTGPILLENVQIVPRDGSKPPISIDRIEGSSGLAGIVFSGGDLGRIRIDGLQADVIFDAARRSNLQGLSAEPVADGAVRPAAPGAADRRRRSVVSMRLEVDDAVVRISGPWTPEPWVSDPIDVRATLAPATAGGYSEWTIAPVQLLTNARLEPSVAKSVLAYIAPVLADATRTGGEFSLRLDGATLPVGDPGSGTLSGELAMHAVDLGPGPLALKTIQELPLRLPPPPTVRIADESRIQFRLADRRVWHKGLEFGLPLKQPGQRLDVNSSGSVGLDDDSLDLKLILPIPADLPQDRPLIASLAGRQISVGVGGSLGDPRVIFDGSIRETAGQVVSEVIERLRNPEAAKQRAQRPEPMVQPHDLPPVEQQASPQPQPKAAPAPGWAPPGAEQNPAAAPTATADSPPAAKRIDDIKSKLPPELTQDPTADAVIDLVGGVLEEVAKRRAERRAAEAANPGQKPPPRGGLLRRRGE